MRAAHHLPAVGQLEKTNLMQLDERQPDEPPEAPSAWPVCVDTVSLSHSEDCAGGRDREGGVQRPQSQTVARLVGHATDIEHQGAYIIEDSEDATKMLRRKHR